METLNVKITGQVEFDKERSVIAEFELICAKYDLELEQIYEEEII